MTLEMCDKVSKGPRQRTVLKYCIDNYKIHERCDKAVGAFLPTLKYVLDWFVTKRILEKLDDVVFSNDDMVFANAQSDNVAFLVMIWVLLM